MLEALEDSGYMVLNKGGRVYNWVKGKIIPIECSCSYIEFTYKLIDLYKPYKDMYKKKPIKNVLEVRDEHKIPKTFKQTSQTKLAKECVNTYNKLSMLQAVCTPKGKRYDCQIRKIFNGNFKTGGRSYMSGDGIQNLTKEERMDLTINSNETVIYDYKAFEPSLAYSMNQEVMKGDPYQLDWQDYDHKTLRSLGKAALTTMLYADDKETAVAALNYNISEDFDVDQLYEDGLIPSKCVPVRRLVEALEKKNEKIIDLLYNPKENNLSHVGSLVMDQIINYFTQRGICVLPVFDEVIIEEEHEDILVEIMEWAYESVVGFTDNCYIVKEK